MPDVFYISTNLELLYVKPILKEVRKCVQAVFVVVSSRGPKNYDVWMFRTYSNWLIFKRNREFKIKSDREENLILHSGNNLVNNMSSGNKIVMLRD